MKFIANSLLDIDGQRTYPGCCVELDADTAAPLVACGFIYPDPDDVCEDEADEQPAGYNGNTADDAIRQAIAAELVAGKSKTAIKQELAGKEIGGVKLTHRLISDYIEKITAEE